MGFVVVLVLVVDSPSNLIEDEEDDEHRERSFRHVEKRLPAIGFRVNLSAFNHARSRSSSSS
jgi:hypothetical protein